MYANYHSHTPRCNHASGSPREYIEAALHHGFRVLGFSDHVPVPFSSGFVSDMRMTPAQTAGYVRELSELREEYADRIRILIGYEAEYFPKDFAATLKLLTQYPCDYLILGQHFVGSEDDGVYCGDPFTEESLLTGYVDQACAGLDTGVFTYFAHPDLPNFVGDPAFYRREMERLCRHAAAADVPLEINMLGLRQGRNYPAERFWQIVAEMGNDVILGCDAHSPSALDDDATEERALALVEKYGLHLLHEAALKPVRTLTEE